MIYSKQIVFRILIVFNFLFCGLTMNLQGQQFKDCSYEGIVSKNISLDSAAILLNSYYQTAVEKQDTTKTISALLSLSSLERQNLNYNLAVTHSGEALFMAEEYGNPYLLARSHEEFGVLNYLFKQDDVAGSNFKQSYFFYKKAFSEGRIEQAQLFPAYYNLLLYYQRTEKSTMSSAYIDSCNQIAEATGMDKIYRIFLAEKKASLKMWRNEYNDAIALLADAAHNLEEQSEETVFQTNAKSFLIIIYGQLAQCYEAVGQINLTKTFFEKSIAVDDTHGEHTFYRAFVFRRYAMLLFRYGDSRNAFVNLMQANDINERYLNPRNEDTQGFLSLKNPYLEELQKKNKELNANKLILAKKTEEALRFRISFFITLFLLISAGLMILIRIQWLKHRRENAQNELQQQQDKALIEEKNKELTTSTLQLIEKEEIIKTLNELIAKNKTDDSTKKILTAIAKRSGNLWEVFNARFVNLNENFYERLQAKVPDLSSTDLKICALIKLNFTGKEMSYLLGISLGSVHVARHRIRKKLNLERDVNLTCYINSI